MFMEKPEFPNNLRSAGYPWEQSKSLVWNLTAVVHATTWLCSALHLHSRIIPRAACLHTKRTLCTMYSMILIRNLIKLVNLGSYLYEFLSPWNIKTWRFLWVSLFLGTLPLSFTQDFDLLIQSPYSNLALNNRQSNNFWCITEKE